MSATDPTAGDHLGTDPGNGKTQCKTCGKWVWLVTHSCKGVRVYPGVADDPRGPNFTGGPTMHTGKPPAEPDAGDVEALAKVIRPGLWANPGLPVGSVTQDVREETLRLARVILASPVLDAVRRKAGDERAEQITQAIEALAVEYETAAGAAIQDGMRVTDREIQFALNVVADLRNLIARESR